MIIKTQTQQHRVTRKAINLVLETVISSDTLHWKGCNIFAIDARIQIQINEQIDATREQPLEKSSNVIIL